MQECIRLRRATFDAARESHQILVAGRVGLVSAPISTIGAISTGGSGTHANGDTRPHSAAHRCAAIDAPAINAGVMDADATDANPSPSSPVREGVS